MSGFTHMLQGALNFFSKATGTQPWKSIKTSEQKSERLAYVYINKSDVFSAIQSTGLRRVNIGSKGEMPISEF